jgi:hypothetical protein
MIVALVGLRLGLGSAAPIRPKTGTVRT